MSLILNIVIGIAIPLILLFLVSNKNAKIPIGFLLLGMLACCLASLLSTAIMELYGYTPVEQARYVAPVVEEFIKALPIVIFFIVRRPDIKTAFMAAVATGVGFATIENILYFLSSNVNNIGFVLARGLSTGIMHAMTLVVVSIVLYRVIKLGALRYIVVFISVLAFSATFHGLYNLLVNSTSVVAYNIGYLLPVILAVVFLVILKHGEIAKLFDKIRRKKTSGENQ